MPLNGNLTQGENLANLNGLKLAYRAYKRIAHELIEPESRLPRLEQYDNDQMFMISMANLWCTRYAENTAFVGDHPPDKFRINGVLMNIPEFSKAFQCKSGDPMNPEEKCAVW
ncbi:hypothetical protein J6590_042250 [Homalodisca vitripennis]|nr:hypothetical protein J6590_042250 [Homalodisca vitripennis]